MPGISRAGVDSAGGTILTGSSDVMINGAPVALNGAAVAPHGDSPHNAASMIATTGKVFVNGIAVVRAGDPATCGHTASGSGNVNGG